MHLATVFVRFYKSFNFDYLRKFDAKATHRHQWEMIGDLWYPYVRIPIDEKITTIVGANESGKTHSLTAIEKGLSGQDIGRGDFCRYSQFFAVEQGKMRWPDFGFEWSGVTRQEAEAIAATCENPPRKIDRFLLFRTERSTLTIYVPTGDGHSTHRVSDGSKLREALPSVFRLSEDVALPESVPIRFLYDDDRISGGVEDLPRSERVGLVDSLWSHFGWFQNKNTVTQSAENIVEELGKFSKPKQTLEGDLSNKRRAEQNLARDLIRKVARVDPEALKELYEALRDGRDAFANSIIDQINDSLRGKLNFPHWWAQDRQFRLLVSPREYDLVFTIRDRTETEYAFGERSSGLRYFLSYYVQYLAHDAVPGRREILLMDEPDAFLSNQGQQDLLKVFHAFATPDNGNDPIQVIYVTHSPFLIDKNHGDRIRVVEKGAGDEGTRVVRDASRNHYEPLRSAFGSFVGETTFIGNCNLVVEGPADQILLAGAATYLRSRGTAEMETLDLNHITIVPASGAPHVPYLVYLARGRDVEKPAVIVLLDSDSEGNAARKVLMRGGPRGKQLLKPEFILQVADLTGEGVMPATTSGLAESEDLLPLGICERAVQRYLTGVCGADASLVERATADAIKSASDRGGIFDRIRELLRSLDPELHVEKIGFARSVIETVIELSKSDAPDAASLLNEFSSNMKSLFRVLRRRQREAERELTADRVSSRVNRAKSSFLEDHPTTAKREHALVLIEDILAALDDSDEADEIKKQIQALQRDFKIAESLTDPIDNYPIFRERLEKIRYAGRLGTQAPTLLEAASEKPNSAAQTSIRENQVTEDTASAG